MMDAKRVKGVAFVETAMWLAAILPIAIAGAGLVGLLHDQNVVMGIPGAVMREADVAAGRWMLAADGSTTVAFDADLLGRAIEGMASRAGTEAAQGVLRTTELSSKACYWIFSVNTHNGSLETPISTECRSQGPQGSGVSFEIPLHRERGEGRGILLGEKGTDGAYADKIALVGVGVRGEFPGALSSDPLARLEWAEVSYLRQEVGL